MVVLGAGDQIRSARIQSSRATGECDEQRPLHPGRQRQQSETPADVQQHSGHHGHQRRRQPDGHPAAGRRHQGKGRSHPRMSLSHRNADQDLRRLRSQSGLDSLRNTNFVTIPLLLTTNYSIISSIERE